ncbi:MAG: sodium-independent anion transporter, partial [Calditrichaeota bacterium]|nr:sodium-independent anion transporter [Calditrichota bacterium]
LDATGLRALEDVYEQARREQTVLILSGVHAQPLSVLQRAGLLQRVGRENVCGNIDTALQRAREILDASEAEKQAE